MSTASLYCKYPPSWDALHVIADGQSGYFTTHQAVSAGFSGQLLYKHVQNGRLERPERGVYRIQRYPPSEDEHLVVIWLWSKQEAVFSHETALSLHGLSDALPARVHLILPTGVSRRKRIPVGVIVHYADLTNDERQWRGPIPITSPARSVRDLAFAHGDVTLISQAINQGIRRHLFGVSDVANAASYVALMSGWPLPIRPGQTLGDRYITSSISGICTRSPSSDWPSVALEIAEFFCATVRVAQYLPSRTMQLELAWPIDYPVDDKFIAALRKKLARSFSWV